MSTDSFKQMIIKTADSLGVGESTTLLLLIKYKWNRDALDSDFQSMMHSLSVLRNCAKDEHAPLANDDVLCFSCFRRVRCHRMKCEHFVCVDCIEGSLER